MKCMNLELCEGESTCLRNPNLCINCDMMFGKSLIFKDDVECPICLESKRGLTQPKCEHEICVECFKNCYYGIYNETDFPYSNEIEEQYDEYGGFDLTPKSFLEMYPLIEKYENECNRQYNTQELIQKINSRCPLCRA